MQRFFLRFSADPILISFTATIANRDYVRGAVVMAGARAGFERLNIDASKLSPAVYIDPLLQGSCFFSKVEVTLDGTNVSSTVLDDRGHIYRKAHRTFTDGDTRKRLYGEDLKWISNSKQRTCTAAVDERDYVPAVKDNAGAVTTAAVPYRPAQPVKMSEEMLSAVQSLTFDAETSSVSGTISCGFDGVFPFNQQCNALRVITGQENENKFLPPNCKIGISLHKRVPLESGIEKSDVTDASYFTSVAQTANTFKIKITGIKLLYDSITVNDSDLAQLKKQTHSFYFDAPLLRVKPLGSGTNSDKVKVDIPVGAKFAYLCFLYEDQVIYNQAQNSFLSARLRFPPNLIDFKIDLPGREGILFEEGIKNMGVKEGFASETLRIYHSDMVRKGHYDKPFDTFFPPRRPDALGYDQAILVDLSSAQTTSVTSMTLNMLYNNNYCPTRWQLNAFFIVQQCLTFSDKDKWKIQSI